ncbi:MAG: leucyl aminopeptidase family protein [Caulobacter sp.]
MGALLEAAGFGGRAGETAWAPLDQPTLLAGEGEGADRWSLAALPWALPEGDYRLCTDLDAAKAAEVAIGWGLGAYRFDAYRTEGEALGRRPARLAWPEGVDRQRVEREVSAMALARDLINTPANDMGPAELADVALTLAGKHDAACEVIVGDDLLEQGYRLVHAVGRASHRAPRLIDLRWGEAQAPKITIVGKGVCFDTGGLDMKAASFMLQMKKDMGGAAHALALTQMVLEARLPVRLRLLIPAVENAVAGDALRPLDVIRARNGLTVEIGNTDAEGRLILADVLAEASDEAPDLLVDFATLTGAARIALGGDLPAMFCNDEALAASFLALTERNDDPVWRMPLWKPYLKDLASPVADLRNVSGGTFAGAINAAVFMERFVREGTPWLHLDTYGWNDKSRPGRPEGGEARNLRSVFDLIADRAGA